MLDGNKCIYDYFFLIIIASEFPNGFQKPCLSPIKISPQIIAFKHWMVSIDL